MTTCCRSSGRRFYRDADRAFLGGVCAGLARHFGLNLKVTRLLALLALFILWPIAIVAYLAVVLITPAAGADVVSEPRHSENTKRERASASVDEIRRRAADLDARLVRLEKYVTSSRYRLDEEFRRL